MIRILLLVLGSFALVTFSGNISAQDEAAAGEEAPAEEEPSTAERALEEMQRRYEELQQRFDEFTGDQLDAPVEWAQEDIENIGDWEYRVVEFGRMSAEELEAALNELGNERWQVIWIEGNLTGRTVIMKRPAVSILSKLPLSALGRLLMRDSGGQ